MTAAELIAILRGFEDDREVILAVDSFEWRSIKQVDPPLDRAEDDVQRAICLVPGGERL